MSIRLLLILSLAGLLASGCGSNKTKDDEPVEVEDLSSGTTDSADGVTEDNGVQVYGTEDGATSGFDELDDPESPLSTRIIYFDYDKSEIREEYKAVVEAHGTYLARNPSTTVTLEGHADERGSREYNLALGERRAQSIKQRLLLLGAVSSQIRLVSYGEERPAVDGHDDASWQQNRRVEILY